MKYMLIKIRPNNLDETLAYIEKTVKTLNPTFNYSYSFLNDDFANMYHEESRLRSQLTFFSLLAILISCMGLWGILMFKVLLSGKLIPNENCFSMI